jgi:hypothetical protein
MKNPSILIATELQSDAQMVKSMHIKKIARIAVSSITTKAAEYFEASRPDVFILTFSTLDLAERHYMNLYRYCQAIHAQPHRIIVLCDQHELLQTYQCCRDIRFDDYVLFWPMAHTEEAQPAATMARQVHQIVYLQRALESYGGDGLKHAETAPKSLSRMISDTEMRKLQDMNYQLSAARADVQTLSQWEGSLMRPMKPHGNCVRSLSELADRGRQRSGTSVCGEGAEQRGVRTGFCEKWYRSTGASAQGASRHDSAGRRHA